MGKHKRTTAYRLRKEREIEEAKTALAKARKEAFLAELELEALPVQDEWLECNTQQHQKHDKKR